MRRPQGYVRIFGPEGTIERDSMLCSHCQRIVMVKPLQDPSSIEYGGTCKGCMKFICTGCVDEMTRTAQCVPFEKKLEQYERATRFAQAAGLVLR